MTTAEGVVFGPSVTIEIESEIRRVVDRQAQRVAGLGSAASYAWERASECLLGGKLLRPRLLMGAFDALAPVEFQEVLAEVGSPRSGSGLPLTALRDTALSNGAAAREQALRIAAAVELLHFAFLLHDDIIDGDLMRRGRPNFIGLQLRDGDAAVGGVETGRASLASQLHAARSSAMLVGDLLLSAAHQIIFSEALPVGLGIRLQQQLDRTVVESVSGELTDVALSAGHVDAELVDVVEMSRQKTATYSFELPLRSAAILAGLGPDVEDTLGQVGAQLGLAYQLQDDLLSTFGRADEHGKDAFSDLREGKETAIIAIARRTGAWPYIAPHFGAGDLSTADGAKVRSLLSECGAEREVRALIDELAANVRELIATEPDVIGPDMAGLIDDLIDMLNGRRS